MGFALGNVLGLLGLLSLIPLIILYLIRPKPHILKVPSLMFFFSKNRTTTAESFLRHFHQDILFFIQLGILFLLALALAQPLLIVNKDAVSKNLIFVLDISASSQVMEGHDSRLELSKKIIKDLATSKNSLILVKSSPVLALQDSGRSGLLRYLDKVESTEDLGDIGSAIILGANLLSDNKGRIVVVGDLITSKGMELNTAKNIVEAKGIHVDFINVANSERDNIGIVDLVLNSDTANVYIKNYNNKKENVKLIINKDVKYLDIEANSVEPYVFNLEKGDTKVRLDFKDDFRADNEIIITRPFGDKMKVLLISGKISKFVKAALNSIEDVDLTIAQLPVIPKDEFDVIILGEVTENDLLEGSFEDLKKRISNGDRLIITAWVGMENLNFRGLLSKVSKINGGLVQVDQVTRFTRDADFGEVAESYSVEDGLSLISVNDKNVISSIDIGNGNLIFYGITDESDFKLSPSYPIFWGNLISYLAGRSDLNDINLKSGGVLDVTNTTSLNLDKTGIFEVGDRKISVNLLSEKESNINLEKELIDVKEIKKGKTKLDKVKVNVDYNLAFYLVLIVILLIGFEFWYIKMRGEI